MSYDIDMGKLKCSCCTDSFKTISQYCNHVSIAHSSEHLIFKCPVKFCLELIKGHAELISHCKEMHKNGSLGLKFDCKYEPCLKKFNSGKEIYTHSIIHLKNSTLIQCPFQNCLNVYWSVHSFRSHVFAYHNGILDVCLNQNEIATNKYETVDLCDSDTSENLSSKDEKSAKINATNSQQTSDSTHSNAAVAGNDPNSPIAPIAVNCANITSIAGGNANKRLSYSNSSPMLRKKKMSDDYGCIEWSTHILPANESVESLEKKKADMITLSKLDPSWVNFDTIVEAMDLCYGPLRNDLNRFPHLKIIKRDWPFIFNTRVGIAHFKRLTGIDCFESVRNFAGKKTDLIFNFTKNEATTLLVASTIVKIEKESRLAWARHAGLADMSPGCKLIAALKALAVFFKEDISMEKLILLKGVDYNPNTDYDPSDAIDRPILIIQGDTTVTGSKFLVMVNEEVLYKTFDACTAFSLFFASYYMFSFNYLPGISKFMEFVQRYIMAINPSDDNGTKKMTKTKGVEIMSKYKLSPIVYATITGLNNLEKAKA